MSQIHPVQALLDEHLLIESVLEAFELKLLLLRAVPFPGTWLSKALDFFRHFVEGCHHNREEELVFPDLREAGLLEQHDAGTPYLDKLEVSTEAARRGDPGAVEDVRREGLAYVRFLREHISQENEILHWVAGQPRTEEEILLMQGGVEPGPFHHMDEQTYQSYITLAETLCATPVA